MKSCSYYKGSSQLNVLCKSCLEMTIYSPILKSHASFLIFDFWDFKLVPLDSALNSGSLCPTIFFSNITASYLEQQSNLQIRLKAFSNVFCLPTATKLARNGTKNFLY